MPNNIIFNNTASQLKTTIYGSEDIALKTDSEGRLEVLTSSNFTESTSVFTDFAAGATFMQDTSKLTEYSFWIANSSSETLTARIQISPTDTEADFIEDVGTELVINGTTTAILVPSRFLKYTRLDIDPSGTSASFTVYFNGH